ncbi:choice-of-anchor A family protein, partial [Myxococcota bacterium]
DVGLGGSRDVPPPPPPPPTEGCIPSWLLPDVNVLVFEDAQVTNADTLGGFWVGGNFSATSGYDVGKDLELDCCRYDFVVGGTADAGGWVSLMNGSAAHGGSFDVNGVSGPPGGTLSVCEDGTEKACGVYETPPDMPDFQKLQEDASSYSQFLANYPPNGEGSGLSLVGGDPYTDPDRGNDVYVFNVSVSSLAGLDLDVPAGSTVIINVAGTDVTFENGTVRIPGGNCGGGGTTDADGGCSTVLYNLYEAETVTVMGMEVPGSILAPDATFLGAGGHVDGQVVVRNMDTAVEFHAYFFSGCLELPDQPGE